MNKGILAIIAAAALSLSKSSKGSPARAVFDSEKAKKRFKDLNGYEMDSLIDVMLDAYVQQFMNLEPFYDFLEQNNIDYDDRPYFKVPMFSTNLGISANLLDSIGIQYKERKRHPKQPDWYHIYDIILKNLSGQDVMITAVIQEDHDTLEEESKDDKNNKLIQEWFDGDEEGNIETFTMETLDDFVKTSMFYRAFFSDLESSFYIKNEGRLGNYRLFTFSSGFRFLKKDLYLKIKNLLTSNKKAMDIFKVTARSSFKHELIHTVELGYNWKVTQAKKHGLKNYMSSRIERRTWGQNVVDEVNFRLNTLRKAEELFPEETGDVFFSPYREEKFFFQQGDLEIFLNLRSIRQYLSNEDLVSKTLEWINLPQNREKFSDLDDGANDFILKTFPILKEKPFQYWIKMAQTSITDKSSGTISFIGGKGDNPESYKKCLKEFFKRCSKKGKIKPLIYVFTGASEQKDAGEYEAKILKEMGADVIVDKVMYFIHNLNGIFFADGDPSKLIKELGVSGKSFIQKANKRGVHIGGTSAGAAVLSEKVIIGGESEPVIADGLGLIKKYIVDPHVSSRNGKERLTKAIKSTGLRGIGLDEDSMIMVFDDGYSDIYGENNITIVFYNDDEKEFEAIEMSDGEATKPGFVF